VVSVISLLVAAGATAAGPHDAKRPYFEARDLPMEYAGPGRDDALPEDLDEIRLGWFGPDDPDHPAGGDLWLAASLAIEEANAAGGYRGAPYRLLAGWSESPWGTGAADLARMIYTEGVWGILGSIDGASTHLAEQLAAKARLVLINSAATDATINLANVAWMFSFPPADDRQAALLARTLTESPASSDGDRLTLVSATDHDSRAATAELNKALARNGGAPLYHFEIGPGEALLDRLFERVAASRPATIVVVASPPDTARLVTGLRRAIPGARLAGGPAMGRRIFLEQAGAAAEGALFPLLCEPAALSGRFARAYLSRFGRHPDCAALQTYDATRLLIAAIERAGPNRALIRDAIEALSPWNGVSGEVRWNRFGQNEGTVRIATIENGRPVAIPGP
jgi:ABC-type branched-subunit amino acid transport system substrate-binding protein